MTEGELRALEKSFEEQEQMLGTAEAEEEAEPRHDPDANWQMRTHGFPPPPKSSVWIGKDGSFMECLGSKTQWSGASCWRDFWSPCR